MIEKDPSMYSWITYLWVIVVSGWGGLVGVHRKMRLGIMRPFNFAEIVGEVVTSAFVGMITFWLCEYSGVPPLLTAAFVAVTGHMGSRALFQIERAIEQKLFNSGPKE